MTAANEALQFDDNALEKKRAETVLVAPSGPRPHSPEKEDIMQLAASDYTDSASVFKTHRRVNLEPVGWQAQ